MPVNVRNFWIKTKVDGRKNTLESGPRARDGGFTTKVTVRDDGEVKHALSITGRCQDGHVILSVYSSLGLLIYRHETPR